MQAVLLSGNERHFKICFNDSINFTARSGRGEGKKIFSSGKVCTALAWGTMNENLINILGNKIMLPLLLLTKNKIL